MLKADYKFKKAGSQIVLGFNMFDESHMVTFRLFVTILQQKCLHSCLPLVIQRLLFL